MDYAFAVAIAIPLSTFIVTVGVIVVKSLKRNNPGIQKAGINSNLLKDLVRRKECDAISEGIAKELKLTREELLRGIDNLGKEIRSIRNAPD